MKIKNLSLLALSALILLSCSSNDDGIQPEPKPGDDDRIKFEIGIAPQTQTRVTTDAQFKSTWENGDAIGIFAVKRAVDNPTATMKATGNYIHNMKLTYNETTKKWSSTDALWHTNDGQVLDFYAYYPYSASVNNPLDFTFDVLIDQSGGNYAKSDLLSAKKTGVLKGQNVILEFKHMLALVQIKLNPEVNVPLLDGDFKVTLKNALTKSTFNWTTVTAAGTATDITMHKVADMTDTYRALLPAQTLTKDTKLFTFVQTTKEKEIDFYYKPTTATTLAASKSTRYDMALGWGVNPNHQYAVGDLFPHVGTKIGIVFWLNNPVDGKSNRGKIMKLSEGPNVAWSRNTVLAEATNYSDGKVNVATIKQLTDWQNNYPPFAWCDNQGRGWYLPAIHELQYIHCAYCGESPETWGSNNYPSFKDRNTAAARKIFNQKLIDAGGKALQEFSHWSSTETATTTAIRLDFIDGHSLGETKTMWRIVRAVLAF